MTIESVETLFVNIVKTDSETYIRYAPDLWMIRSNASDDMIYHAKEMEDAFQAFLKNNNW